MQSTSPTRKARFRAALALADMTAKEWCDREGYSETHVYLYFSGRRDSVTLTEKMEAFIAEHLGQTA